ncbi:hypothetical protein [Pirellula sp. SH-Sr6A]|uniref:hypothetical protein n=1 Tax=Pirellula sp. SH-Sr6A TaxID=1632865 RepID=UPI0011BAAE20|nr:hypothetical protein [Pirellula sp. SH-Sr6A]
MPTKGACVAPHLGHGIKVSSIWKRNSSPFSAHFGFAQNAKFGCLCVRSLGITIPEFVVAFGNGLIDARISETRCDSSVSLLANAGTAVTLGHFQSMVTPSPLALAG